MSRSYSSLEMSLGTKPVSSEFSSSRLMNSPAVQDLEWSMMKSRNSSLTRSPSCSKDQLCSWPPRSEEHTSELQSPCNLVCRLLLEKKKHQPLAYHYSIKAQVLRHPRTRPLARLARALGSLLAAG